MPDQPEQPAQSPLAPETKPEVTQTLPPPILPTDSPAQPSPIPPKKPQSEQSKKTTRIAIITSVSIIGGLFILALGVVGGIIAVRTLSPNALPSLSAGVDGNSTVTAQESTIAAVAEKVGPSVVSIVTSTRSRSNYGTTSGSAAGTGIIVSKDGYIMTNNHVIDGATSVSVIDSKGELYEDVTIIGRDPLNDIAFLKVKTNKDFIPASLGNSATLRTGQQVVAIGNALGQYSNTVTSGIVSGTGRPITASSEGGTTESLTDLIQTDASINPGNSGGPLVNMSGQVIGINTAIVEDANGIGFAIPVNATKGILAGVLENGKVSRSYLGVNYVTITPDVARENKLSVNSGAYVKARGSSNPVGEGSPAQKAGLKDGDIITKVNNETVGKDGSLSSILGEYRPGDKITLTILRDGKEQTLTATLDAYKQ